ncbi:TetR/AcrR family transcriptional regulator [Methylobacterium terricola]|nr:TetR/AcrR family transcriptional regulator [Methylobacterium terricola]
MSGKRADAIMGRPRQDELDERLLASAIALLTEHGQAGLSVNRICQHAGLPRATFYRRWPSAMAAVIDAYHRRMGDALLIDRGDIHADLTAWGIGVRDRYRDPVIGVCVPIFRDAYRTDPDRIAPMVEALRQRRNMNVGTLAQALSAQDLSPHLNPFDIIYTLNAAIDYGHSARQEVSDAFIARLVHALLG